MQAFTSHRKFTFSHSDKLNILWFIHDGHLSPRMASTSGKMRSILFILCVMIFSGCARTFHNEPDSYYLQVLADARQLSQGVMLYQHEHSESDGDDIIGLEEVLAAEPNTVKAAEIRERIKRGEIIYFPHHMPLSERAILTIAVIDNYVGITRADLNTETFKKE